MKEEQPKLNNVGVSIKAPNFKTAVFEIIGTAPLVVHRFSAKTKNQMVLEGEQGKEKGKKKVREPKNTDEVYEEAKYVSYEGWEGFNASAIRNSMISVCRLVDFKMTLAKMSVFVEADGWDKYEPQIPLVRIFGKSVKQIDMARVETGQPYPCVRAAYHNWKSKVTIRWDADQFSLQDVTNLLARVGLQNGLCEGRPNSKDSAGMGWGLFKVGENNEK
jgi:hypothetical protein